MSQFVRDKAGAAEADQKKALAYLFAQDSTGLATDGVLTGLAVAQTATASTGVLIGAGSAVAQDSVGNGASLLGSDTQITLDVLTANPVGGVPRNDIVVFDSATVSAGSGGIRAIIGTPNASPTDPTVPATAVPLARLRHAASAATIPTAKIDDLRVFTSLFGGKPANKRSGWGIFTGNLGSGGAGNWSHGMPFTPTVVLANDAEADATAGDIAFHIGIGSISSTVVQFVCYKYDGTYLPVGTNVTIHAWFGE